MTRGLKRCSLGQLDGHECKYRGGGFCSMGGTSSQCRISQVWARLRQISTIQVDRWARRVSEDYPDLEIDIRLNWEIEKRHPEPGVDLGQEETDGGTATDAVMVDLRHPGPPKPSGVYVTEANGEVFSIHETLDLACRYATEQGLDVRFMQFESTRRSRVLHRGSE